MTDYLALSLPEHRADLHRLFSKISHIDSKGCWIWRGTAKTYPRFWAGKRPHRTISTAHRFVLVALGHKMKGLVGRHTCDNKRCVNPAHLIPGTHKDNADDASDRGLASLPPKTNWVDRMKVKPHHWQKLSAGDIPEIRRRLAEGETQRKIAADYGVSDNAVWHIKAGDRWRHVA